MLAEKVGDNGDHRIKKVVSKSQRKGVPHIQYRTHTRKLGEVLKATKGWSKLHGWEKHRDEVEGLQTWRLPLGGRSTVDPAASVLPEKKHRIRMKGYGCLLSEPLAKNRWTSTHRNEIYEMLSLLENTVEYHEVLGILGSSPTTHLWHKISRGLTTPC